jgi:hypothetical protein
MKITRQIKEDIARTAAEAMTSLEARAAEQAEAGASAFRRRNFFACPRQAGLNYKIFRDKQKQAYDTPGKRQHGNVSADRYAVKKDGSVFIFGDFAFVLNGNIFPFLICHGGMNKRTDRESAQFNNENCRETGPGGQKQRTMGGGRQGYNLVNERK